MEATRSCALFPESSGYNIHLHRQFSTYVSSMQAEVLQRIGSGGSRRRGLDERKEVFGQTWTKVLDHLSGTERT